MDLKKLLIHCDHIREICTGKQIDTHAVLTPPVTNCAINTQLCLYTGYYELPGLKFENNWISIL